MRPLSNDLRERILAAVDNREGSRRRLAVRFAVNVSTITRLLQLRRETGSFAPRPHGGAKEPTLDQEGLDRLREIVHETPDATLEQLQRGLGVSGSIMIVWRGLQKLDITRKKKTQHATERDRPEVQKERRSFRRKVAPNSICGSHVFLSRRPSRRGSRRRSTTSSTSSTWARRSFPSGPRRCARPNSILLQAGRRKPRPPMPRLPPTSQPA